MRLPAAFAILAAALVQLPSKAAATEYPWCAIYYWEADNCGFVTFEQCLAAVSGAGGHCTLNPRYLAAAPPTRSVKPQKPR